MPKVTTRNDGKGDAMVNTETGEETETMDDVLRPVFSPLGVAELTGKKCEYRKVRSSPAPNPRAARRPHPTHRRRFSRRDARAPVRRSLPAPSDPPLLPRPR